MDEQQMGAAVPADGAPGGPRQATPEQQKQFETLAKQAMSMLLSEQSTELILAGAKAKGGEQAIADAVVQVMKAAVQAAQAAGVQVGEDVIDAAAQPAVVMLARAAETAGLVKDGQATVQQVMAQVAQAVGGGEASPDEGPAQDAAGVSAADQQEF